MSRMRLVTPATDASVLPASNHVGPIACARETGTAGWSLQVTQARPAASHARADSRIFGPSISRSHVFAREGICWIPGRPVPKAGAEGIGTGYRLDRRRPSPAARGARDQA